MWRGHARAVLFVLAWYAAARANEAARAEIVPSSPTTMSIDADDDNDVDAAEAPEPEAAGLSEQPKVEGNTSKPTRVCTHFLRVVHSLVAIRQQIHLDIPSKGFSKDVVVLTDDTVDDVLRDTWIVAL